MSEAENLEDLYVEELGDLWSANDQMVKVVRDMASVAAWKIPPMEFRSIPAKSKRFSNSADKARPRSIAKAWRAW